MALLQRLRAPLGRLATQSRVFAAAYHEKVTENQIMANGYVHCELVCVNKRDLRMECVALTALSFLSLFPVSLSRGRS